MNQEYFHSCKAMEKAGAESPLAITRKKCLICKREMKDPENWGGDCVDCMAKVGGDPDALEYIQKRDLQGYGENK